MRNPRRQGREYMITKCHHRALVVHRPQPEKSWPQKGRSQVTHHIRDTTRWHVELPERRGRTGGQAEENSLKGKGELCPLGTLRQLEMAPRIDQDAPPLPGVRR